MTMRCAGMRAANFRIYTTQFSEATSVSPKMAL